jgi:dUTP pyrophosphatase
MSSYSYTLHLYTKNDELKELYRNISAKYKGDCGVDLYIPSEKTLSSDRTHFISHEIVCWMTDDNDYPVSYYLYPRSSISKTPFRLANSVGIIDSGYRGEIIAAIDVLHRELARPKLERHSRLFQICAPTLGPVRLVIEDEIMDGDRGDNGFGSTGK